jgi:hypothetical protein
LSGLTKLFVGLLVVLSIILAAAAVGTVATLDNYVLEQEQSEATNQSLQRQLSTVQNDANLAATVAGERTATLTEQLSRTRQQVEELRADLAGANAEAATAQTQVQEANARADRLAQALVLSQETQNKQSEAIAQLRSSNDQRLQEVAQLNTTVTDLTRNLNVTTRQMRSALEELQEFRQQNDRLSRYIQDQGADAEGIATGATRGGVGTPPPINGVIRDTDVIAGKTFATISVGRNDDVARGMEFNVISQGGQFLGVLTVQRVDADEAIGVLSGTDVSRVQPGSTVRTQFSS